MRLGTDVPKQYVSLGARTVLEHSMVALAAEPRIDRIFVVVLATDDKWRAIDIDPRRVEFLPVGGSSRAHSVRNGLNALAAQVHDDDRVLVHDAARPCLGRAELTRLIDEVGDDECGGLLAMPMTDTLKRGRDGRVVQTLQRDTLWCAQTPQMFRVAALRHALAGSLDGVTDEASAIERKGNFPKLVLGSATNIKITTEQDLALARALLADLQ